MPMVGNPRKVADLARHGGRADLCHSARSPLGSTVVDCVVCRDGVRGPGADSVEQAVRTSEVVNTGEAMDLTGPDVQRLAVARAIQPLGSAFREFKFFCSVISC